MKNKPQPMKQTNASSSKRVPKLRFLEFQDAPEWEDTTIGDEASIFKGKGISKADLDSNGSQPCIRYGELYTQYGEVIEEVFSRTSKPATDLCMSRHNDVIIPSSGETKIDIATASCVMREKVALGGDLNIIRSKVNGVFLSYYLNGPKRFDIARVAQGDTVVHLYPIQLQQVGISLPKPVEQQRIADCLSSLDEWVAAEEKRLDALKDHKKGLMQQLFPAEGETTPKLRFPEFQDAPEWEKKKLKDLAVRKTKRNRNGSIVRVLTNSAEHGVLDQRDYFDKDIATQGNLESYFTVDVGDFVYNPRISAFAPVGPLSRNNIAEGVISPLYTIFRFKEKKSDFYEHLFKSSSWHSYMLQVGNTGARHGRMSINIDDFMAMPLLVPTTPEQRCIVDCLSSLDDLVSAQANRLDALKEHKKGLMQQLFPFGEEGNA